MQTARTLALLLASGAVAPLQCPARRPVELRHEESPEEALWLLSERFGSSQSVVARRATLEFLIERYPTSRYAERARIALETQPDAGR